MAKPLPSTGGTESIANRRCSLLHILFPPTGLSAPQKAIPCTRCCERRRWSHHPYPSMSARSSESAGRSPCRPAGQRCRSSTRQTSRADPRGPKCPLERASSLASSFARKAGASVHAWNDTRAVAAPSGSAARAARAKADLPFPGGPTRRTGDARVRRVLLTKQSRVVSIVGTKTSPGPALIEQLTNSCGIIPPHGTNFPVRSTKPSNTSQSPMRASPPSDGPKAFRHHSEKRPR
mmetsp:Transcript_22687/g.67746  ORF Transcript_22687/g.67746 Transcript_22687/m.67746 type:complete len:235 (-) Transcript_22687:1071-1775(-)